MADYYLRVEGVNLASVLEDTEQLSVIRGGGLMLRQVATELPEQLPDLKLRGVSCGASIGLFAFSSEAPNEVRTTASQYLAKHYPHFTFVVDIQADNANFQRDKEAVLARNRFRQLQQLTVAMPAPNTDPDQGACALDNLRPVAGEETIHQERTPVSASVFARFRFGRDKRAHFYHQETEIDPKPAFTHTLENIAKLTKTQEKNPELRQLNNKIAVVYFDGNGFSKIQNAYCDTQRKQEEFDQFVQEKRKDFLTHLLPRLGQDATAKTEQGELRLETLLWGGDEMIFVVPAWQGFAVLNHFYEISADWNFHQTPLTHAGGIVFCSAKTPIHRVTRLAKQLAEGVKDNDQIQGRNGNYFDYLVLESVDYPTEPLETSRARFPLVPFTESMRGAAVSLQQYLPKGQVYACARAAWVEYNDRGPLFSLATQFERLVEMTEIPDREMQAIQPASSPEKPESPSPHLAKTRWIENHLDTLLPTA